MNSSPINALKVQVSRRRGPHSDDGWEFHPVDTNTGVGGKYIYIGYKRGDTDPVTFITFRSYEKKQTSNPMKGWNWNEQDLKEGAGGKYIYMFWRTRKEEPNAPTVMEFNLVVTGERNPPPIPPWEPIYQELNEDAGGEFIWPYIKR